jgi:hypothetical protein
MSVGRREREKGEKRGREHHQESWVTTHRKEENMWKSYIWLRISHSYKELLQANNKDNSILKWAIDVNRYFPKDTQMVNKQIKKCWTLVAHTCNTSYSEGRNQEDHDLKPAQTKSSMSPCLEKPFTKIWLSSSSRMAKKKKQRSVQYDWLYTTCN